MAEIDPAQALDALTRHAGNVIAAAKELGVPTSELRKHRGLIAQALEAEERALDKAEASLKRALRSGPLAQRMKAAAFIVRMSRRGF